MLAASADRWSTLCTRDLQRRTVADAGARSFVPAPGSRATGVRVGARRVGTGENRGEGDGELLSPSPAPFSVVVRRDAATRRWTARACFVRPGRVHDTLDYRAADARGPVLAVRGPRPRRIAVAWPWVAVATQSRRDRVEVRWSRVVDGPGAVRSTDRRTVDLDRGARRVLDGRIDAIAPTADGQLVTLIDRDAGQEVAVHVAGRARRVVVPADEAPRRRTGVPDGDVSLSAWDPKRVAITTFDDLGDADPGVLTDPWRVLPARGDRPDRCPRMAGAVRRITSARLDVQEADSRRWGRYDDTRSGVQQLQVCDRDGGVVGHAITGSWPSGSGTTPYRGWSLHGDVVLAGPDRGSRRQRPSGLAVTRPKGRPPVLRATAETVSAAGPGALTWSDGRPPEIPDRLWLADRRGVRVVAQAPAYAGGFSWTIRAGTPAGGVLPYRAAPSGVSSAPTPPPVEGSVPIDPVPSGWIARR